MPHFEEDIAQVVQIVCYDGATPTVPTNVGAEISTDGGAFAATSNTPASVGNGLVTLSLTAAEMDCDYYTIRITSDNLEDHLLTFYNEDDYTAARAAYLDAAITTRSSHGDPDPSGYLDAAVTSRATQAEVLSDATPIDGGNLNTLSGYSPDNTIADVDNIGALNDPDASTIATAVWNNATRTLTSFGTLVQDIWDKAKADLSTAGSIGKVLADFLTGRGSKELQVTVQDSSGNTYANAAVTIKSSENGAIVATGSTNASGVITFNLDNDTYYMEARDTASYSAPNPQTVTHDSDPTTATITVTPIATPSAPTASDRCTVYAYFKDEGTGNYCSAGDAYLYATAVLDRKGQTTLVLADDSEKEDGSACDDNGYASLELYRGIQYKVTAEWPDNNKERVTVTVPDAGTYDVGQVLQTSTTS